MFIKKGIIIITGLILVNVSIYGQSKINIGGKPENQSSFKRVKALIFGISSYKNLPLEKQLEFADDDAIDFYKFLLDRNDIIKPYNIFPFFNQKATGKTKIEGLLYNHLVKDAKKGDLIIIYFAGHGNVQSFANNKEEGFLLFHNVNNDGDYLAPGNDAIPMRTLQHYISLAPTGLNIILITDACRSGKLIGGEKNTAKFLAELVQEWEKTWKLVSCQPNQVSQENKRWGNGHGVFSYYLLKGIKGLADVNKDNHIQFFELFDYVKENVQKETSYNQIPKANGDETATLFPVDLATKQSLEQTELQKQSSSFTPGSALMLMLSGVRGNTSNYFYGVPTDKQTIIQQFQEAIQKGHLISGDIEKSTSPIDATIKKVEKYGLNNADAHAVAISPDGKMLAIGGDTDHVHLIDLTTHKEIGQLEHRGVLKLTFASNGKILFSGGWDQKMKIWNLETKTLIAEKFAHSNDIRLFAFSPTKEIIATAGNGNKIKIWTTNDFTELKEFDALHKKQVTSVIFSGSEPKFYTSGLDGKITIRDINDGKILRQIKHTSPVTDMQYNSKANMLIAVDDKGNLLKINPSTLFVQTKERISNYPFSTVRCIDGEPIVFIAGQEHLAYIYHLIENKIIVKIQIPRGASDVYINPLKNMAAISMYGGQVHTVTFERLQKRNITHAWEYFTELKSYTDISHLYNRLDSYMTSALQTEAEKTIVPFIEGSESLPSVSQINRGLECLKLANNIETTDQLLQQRIATNTKLLRIFKTLKMEDMKNLPEAIKMVEEIIDIEKDAAYTHNTLSVLYRRLNELQKSKASGMIAAERIPTWTEPKVNIGKSYLNEGNYEMAKREFRKVIKLAPENPKGYINMAYLYAYLTYFDSARHFVNLALDKSANDIGINIKAAKILIYSNQLTQAEQMLTEIQKTYNNIGINNLLAKINQIKFIQYYNASGKVNFYLIDQAVDKLNQIKNKQDHNTLIIKGDLYSYGYYVYQNSPVGFQQKLLTSFHISNKNEFLYESFKAYQDVIKANPFNIEATLGLARVKQMRGNIDKAKEYVSDLQNLLPQSPWPDYIEGRIYMQEQKYSKAQDRFKAAIEKDNCFAIAYIFSSLAKTAIEENASFIDKAFKKKKSDINEIFKSFSKNLPHSSIDITAPLKSNPLIEIMTFTAQ